MTEPNDPSANGGPPGKHKGLSRNDKMLLGVVGAGAALGLLVLARKGAGTPASTDPNAALLTTGQPLVQPAMFSDAGIGAYNNLQSEIEALQGQISGLQPTSGTTTTPPPATGGGSLVLHRIGKVGTSYSLWSQAQRFAKTPSDPNSVSAELAAILAANPTLQNRSNIPGGFPLQVPTPGV